MPIRRRRTRLLSWLPLSLAVLLAGCGRPAATPAAPPPAEVGVIKVQGRSTPLSMDIVGDIRAWREVELRPRVSGVVEKQLFRPGQAVREGQPLFLIDTRSLDSALADAQARLLEAQATLQRAHQDVERYRPLLVDDAIPRQTYEQAVSAEQQAQALVASRQEGVNRARIDRGYAEVRAPVSGRIGLQQVEVGGLATAGQTVLAIVSTLDPVAVYFSIPEVDFIRYARRAQGGQGAQGAQAGEPSPRPLELLLADGSKYAQQGRLDFADRAVSTSTGTLTLRAIFPNPDGLLRPGMTGRVRLVYDVVPNAVLVPQKAVTEMLGRQFVNVVGEGSRIEQRPVQVGERIGDQWLVRSGLKVGDTVVVEGVHKARAGSVVRPVPATLATGG